MSRRAQKHSNHILTENPSHQLRRAAKAKKAGPRFDVVRDNVVNLGFDAQVIGVDTSVVTEVLGEVSDAFIGNLAGYRIGTTIGCVFHLDWGAWNAQVTADNRDAVVAAFNIPGLTQPKLRSDVDAILSICHEAIQHNHGVHPVYGNVLSWHLATLPSLHPLRQGMRRRIPNGDAKVPLETALHAIALISQRLAQVKDDELRWTYYSNYPEIIAEYGAILEDCFGDIA